MCLLISDDLLNSLNRQKLVLSVNDLITVTLSSSYDLPFVLPGKDRFPSGSTAYDIKKYIAQFFVFARRRLLCIDLCRNSLKEDEELLIIKYTTSFFFYIRNTFIRTLRLKLSKI